MKRSKAVLEGVTGDRIIGGNTVEPFRNGDEIFPAMLGCIEDAERTIDMLTYVYWTGDIAVRMAHTLARRAKEGLRVRVLLDAVGTLAMDNTLVDHMQQAGCIVERFRPIQDRPTRAHHRTHRKLLICDEQVAMTGGVGIAEEWEGDARTPEEWRDTHFRVTGPAVRPMTAAFVEHWVEAGHPAFTDDDRFPDLEETGDAEVMVVRGSSGPAWHRVGLAMEALLCLAEREICLTTAYFVPGDRMLGKICAAAERGVSVNLLVPGTHMDHRVVQMASADEYEQMMECGVAIHHYERTMLHAKIMVVDGEVALIGSANVDERSLRHNEEVGLVVFDEGLCATLNEHFAEDLSHSEPIDLERWKQRPLWRKAVEAMIDPIEDLL